VAVDRASGAIKVLRVCQVYECGKITSPANLRAQVEGAIVMGLGPALRESMSFADGRIENASFWKYEVPRIKDVPKLDIHLLDRPDLPSVGAGETPLIAVAPAIASAVFHATGERLRQMPMRLPT
jgi:isoquinoline 1-oxidoreductase beta subunit